VMRLARVRPLVDQSCCARLQRPRKQLNCLIVQLSRSVVHMVFKHRKLWSNESGQIVSQSGMRPRKLDPLSCNRSR
jgi:hypothetical protein